MFTEKQHLMAILQKPAKTDAHKKYAHVNETTEIQSAIIKLQIVLRNKRISSHLPTVVNSSFH